MGRAVISLPMWTFGPKPIAAPTEMPNADVCARSHCCRFFQPKLSLVQESCLPVRQRGKVYQGQRAFKILLSRPGSLLGVFPFLSEERLGGGECRRRWREHKRKQQKFSSQNAARSFQTHLLMLFPDLWRTSCAARSSPRQLSHRCTHPNPPGTEWHGQLVYLQVAARNCGLTCSGDIGHQRSPGRSNTSLAFRPGPLRASRRARTGCRSVL